jgi:hypothetical protein
MTEEISVRLTIRRCRCQEHKRTVPVSLPARVDVSHIQAYSCEVRSKRGNKGHEVRNDDRRLSSSSCPTDASMSRLVPPQRSLPAWRDQGLVELCL